jgi:hypothetical protein
VDASPQAVTARLAPLLKLVWDALRAGIAVSAEIHARQSWNPGADRHTEHALVRREAMERLRPYGASLDDADNLGLPMSGLILRSAEGDLLRVWHSEDGELPPAVTRPLRAFFHQEPSRQWALFVGESAESTVDVGPAAPSNLALLWDDDGTYLTRFDLVRPYGVDGRRPLVDWQVDLLGWARRAEDAVGSA